MLRVIADGREEAYLWDVVGQEIVVIVAPTGSVQTRKTRHGEMSCAATCSVLGSA